jgi:hypothetical protein
MKKFLVLLISVLTFSFAKAQSINSISPSGETITFLDNSYVRISVSATLDKKAFAVVFSVDPIGATKLQRGKNNNAWAGVAFPSGNGDLKFYELTAILDGIEPGEHTLRVDVYSDSKTLVDSRETTFTIYIP